MAEEITHKDIRNEVIHVGYRVAYVETGYSNLPGLKVGIVQKINPKSITVERDSGEDAYPETLLYPNRRVLILE